MQSIYIIVLAHNPNTIYTDPETKAQFQIRNVMWFSRPWKVSFLSYIWDVLILKTMLESSKNIAIQSVTWSNNIMFK